MQRLRGMRDELRRELLGAGVLGLVGLGAGAALLAALQPQLLILRWLLQSLACWALAFGLCWQLRSSNRRQADTSLLPTLGAANRLTLLRGWLVAATAGFLAQPITPALLLAPALLYSAAAVADRLDGWLARRRDGVSLLGAALDTRYDALGLVVAPLLAVRAERLHASYLLVSVAYYLFVFGQWWRTRHGKPLQPLLPSPLRRTLAGMQMGIVAAALWPPLDPALTRVAGFCFMLPLLLGFVVDWCVVSARLPAQGALAQWLYQRLPRLSAAWGLPALRLLLATLLPLMLSLPVPAATVPLAWLALALMLTGTAARSGAALLLGLLCWQPQAAPPAPVTLLLLAVTTAILLLGSGRASLWRGDEGWLAGRDGA